jgi:hydroxyacylglutathione hydrolase
MEIDSYSQYASVSSSVNVLAEGKNERNAHRRVFGSHWDHTGANEELKSEGVTVVGPVNEKSKIPGIDSAVGQGDVVEFGSTKATVMDVGGHTKGHIAYYFPESKSVFVGDSLFALGCGRMFEGTPDQFWTSLKGLRELPDDTTVYW